MLILAKRQQKARSQGPRSPEGFLCNQLVASKCLASACLQALVKAATHAALAIATMASLDKVTQKLETLALEQRDESAQTVVGREGAAEEGVCAVMPKGAFAFSDLKQRKAERKAQRAAERQQ
ncbi:uncharacterized protein LOC119575791 [Penaeus monodon]|uniref:uncharacterized protein LOC119575791 n=1 Tax=Penaeus monodon TaxID=6687 RepID=UPI0018A72BA6|nr:uncharacterized protein LOC119575791 [Penaeus monodon]